MPVHCAPSSYLKQNIAQSVVVVNVAVIINGHVIVRAPSECCQCVPRMTSAVGQRNAVLHEHIQNQRPCPTSNVCVRHVHTVCYVREIRAQVPFVYERRT